MTLRDEREADGAGNADKGERDEEPFLCIAPVGDGTQDRGCDGNDYAGNGIRQTQSGCAESGISPYIPELLEEDGEESCHDRGGKGGIRPVIHGPGKDRLPGSPLHVVQDLLTFKAGDITGKKPEASPVALKVSSGIMLPVLSSL
jgi:hypothetical protein